MNDRLSDNPGTASKPAQSGSAVGDRAPDDKTGYKRPPRATQFRPGQSGNPTGRRNGSRNLRTDVAEVLSGQVVFCDDGHERTISRQEAVLVSLYNKGVNGDVKAITALLSMAARLLEPADTSTADELSEADTRLLEDFLRNNGGLPGDER